MTEWTTLEQVLLGLVAISILVGAVNTLLYFHEKSSTEEARSELHEITNALQGGISGLESLVHTHSGQVKTIEADTQIDANTLVGTYIVHTTKNSAAAPITMTIQPNTLHVGDAVYFVNTGSGTIKVKHDNTDVADIVTGNAGFVRMAQKAEDGAVTYITSITNGMAQISAPAS